MISRMLKEAREKGIVDIRIRRPLAYERSLENALVERFGLESAHVLIHPPNDDQPLVKRLGEAGAEVLSGFLRPGLRLGIAWGTAVSATVNALEVVGQIPVEIVQLAGALGARRHEYDGNTLAESLRRKLGGDIFYLNAPYIVESKEAAKSLLSNADIREAIERGKGCDVAVVGIGSIDPAHSSFDLADYASPEELEAMLDQGAVGDVCGRQFNMRGRPVRSALGGRLMAIQWKDLLAIPIRIGVSGGPGKVKPILGAARGRVVNVLVTDKLAAEESLRMDAAPGESEAG